MNSKDPFGTGTRCVSFMVPETMIHTLLEVWYEPYLREGKITTR